MTTILFANNAKTTLAGSISNVATTAVLAAGSGALFPSPTLGQYFCMTFVNSSTGLLREIVHVTERVGDTVTIERAQEGTTALAWAAGDLAQNLLTAGSMTAIQSLGLLPPRNYKAGFTLANNGGSPNTVIDVGVGSAADASNAVLISDGVSSIDFTTTGAGGLDAGAIGASRWYACYKIAGPGVVSSIAHDTTGTAAIPAPTLPTGYTTYRYIGSVRTNASAQIISFTQVGDSFFLGTPLLDVADSSVGTTAALYTLTTPPGIVTQPLTRIFAGYAVSVGGVLIITSPQEPDIAPTTNITIAPAYDLNDIQTPTPSYNQGPTGTLIVMTNTQSQIRARASDVDVGMTVINRGWIDTFGRNA